jgi:hypothetical protein
LEVIDLKNSAPADPDDQLPEPDDELAIAGAVAVGMSRVVR